MWRPRIPPTKRMLPVAMAMVMVVPMSGWSITRPPKKQNMSPTGRSTARQSPTLATRRASRSAQYRSSPSLANSDGWKRADPMPSHRVEPFTLTPTPGTSTSSNSPAEMTSRGPT